MKYCALLDGDEAAVIKPADARLRNEAGDDVFHTDVDRLCDLDGEMTASLPRLALGPLKVPVGGMEARPVFPIDVNLPAESDRSDRGDRIFDAVKSAGVFRIGDVVVIHRSSPA